MRRFPSLLFSSFFLVYLLVFASNIFGQTSTAVSYLGAYTLATLPTTGVNTGDVATVTDSTRGIWQYDGTKWIAKDGRRPSALDFCNPATTSDCTSGLQAAIDALSALDGGTIVFPAGYTFQFASQLNLVDKRDIAFEGTVTKGSNGTTNLLYTGSGSSTAFDMRSSNEITFRNLHVVYNNSGFTGWLLQTGHAASGADTYGLLIDNCVIGGFANAYNASGLVDLTLSIVGKIIDSHFIYAHVGIRGINGSPNYAYIYNIDNNSFNSIETAIYNPDANWRISGNTFEPDLNGKTVGIDSDNSYYIRGVKIEANYFGDASSATQPQLRIRKGLGVSVSNNWFTLAPNGTAMEFTECQGLNITANRVESDTGGTTGILFSGGSAGGYNYATTVTSNSLNVGHPIVGGYIIGISEISNETGGSALTNVTTGGLDIQGNAGTTPVSSSPTTLTIGSIYNSIDYNNGGGIRMTNALGTHPDGSMIIQARNRDLVGDIVLRTAFADVLTVNYYGVTLGSNLSGTTGAFTGNVTFPTQPTGDNSTNGATTAFVQAAVNSASPIGSASLNFPSIAAGSTSELTISVSSATAGDAVTVSPSGGPESGLIWSGYVSASGTVTVRLANVTGSAIDPATRNWTAKVR